MARSSQLRLVESSLNGVLPDGYGGEAEAEFRVITRGSRGRQEVYKLTAVNVREYERWYLELMADEEVISREARPLVVPDAVLAVTGLVEHVTHEYLDPADPYRINRITDCLEGPLNLEESHPLAA